jgi:hypothetical protein
MGKHIGAPGKNYYLSLRNQSVLTPKPFFKDKQFNYDFD